MQFAVLLEFMLLLNQTAPGVFELRLQELVRPVCQHLTVVQVLLDEQRREPFRHPHDRTRFSARVRHSEGVAFDDLDIDVATHPFDDILHDSGFALFVVQVEVLDDPLQTRTTQDLLRD